MANLFAAAALLCAAAVFVGIGVSTPLLLIAAAALIGAAAVFGARPAWVLLTLLGVVVAFLIAPDGISEIGRAHV